MTNRGWSASIPAPEASRAGQAPASHFRRRRVPHRNGLRRVGRQGQAGVWESTAGSFQANTTGYVEFGHIVEGAARLVDPDGTVHELVPGSSFVMPEGYTGRWEVDQFVKKIYFISRQG